VLFFTFFSNKVDLSTNKLKQAISTFPDVHVLLEHGANACAEDCERRTPLHAAVEYGRVGVIHVLLEHGANVGAEDNQGRTPFQLALALREYEILEVLIKHDAYGV
jgi:ankyrin repeat protein